MSLSHPEGFSALGMHVWGHQVVFRSNYYACFGETSGNGKRAAESSRDNRGVPRHAFPRTYNATKNALSDDDKLTLFGAFSKKNEKWTDGPVFDCISVNLFRIFSIKRDVFCS